MRHGAWMNFAQHVAAVAGHEGHATGAADALQKQGLSGAQLAGRPLHLHPQKAAVLQLPQNVGAPRPPEPHEAGTHTGGTRIHALAPGHGGMGAQGLQHLHQGGSFLAVNPARLGALQAEQVSSHHHPRSSFPENPSP